MSINQVNSKSNIKYKTRRYKLSNIVTERKCLEKNTYPLQGEIISKLEELYACQS